ncbi:DUF498-domain-containing protein [Roridomyces roridus]|uniref:NADH dehydrogenase [ubiquinone] 1 alpha subcomplex assembly factor 3 n=1 Tax=Roridomyces roridus TaxID=1738132 RepID=A0AAD7C5K3_9AGAR|nr:DUF498-domain-containing protein [Roridomyces roridus]
MSIRLLAARLPCRASSPFLQAQTINNSRPRFIQTTPPRQNSRPTSLTNILASDTPPAVQVSSVSEDGILLEDGLLLPAACIFLDGKVFLWDVPDSVTQWGREHLAMFEVVVPKPEILILGTGVEMAHPPPSFRSHLAELGIQLDVMSTKNACSTYNLLSEEGRRVAAALAPLVPRRWQKSSLRQ